MKYLYRFWKTFYSKQETFREFVQVLKIRLSNPNADFGLLTRAQVERGVREYEEEIMK